MEVELTRGERFKDARTVHNQHGKQSQGEVAEAVKIGASLLSDVENDDKNRDISMNKLIALSQHYGVSLEYLCGLSDIWSTDKDLHACGDYFGLSEVPARLLHQFKDVENDTLNSINKILSCTSFYRALDYLHKALVVQRSKKSEDVENPEEYDKFCHYIDDMNDQVIMSHKGNLKDFPNSKNRQIELYTQLAVEQIRMMFDFIISNTKGDE